MKVDYSPKALSLRLKQVDDLRELCVALAATRLKVSWQRASADARKLVPEMRSSYSGNAKSTNRRKEAS